MRIHRILACALFATPLIPVLPSGASATDWGASVVNLQQYKARVGEHMSPHDCETHYRSFEIRNRMSTSARRAGLAACIAAQERKTDTRVADVTIRTPVPVIPAVPTAPVGPSVLPGVPALPR